MCIFVADKVLHICLPGHEKKWIFFHWSFENQELFNENLYENLEDFKFQFVVKVQNIS